MICLIQLVINKAPSSMVASGLKIAVLDLSLILFIKSELLCRRFAPLSNSKIRRDTGRLENEAFMSNPIVSSKQ